MTFLGLIAGTPYFLEYLAAYNLVFVVPLVAVLLVCSSKSVTLRFRRWRQAGDEKFRLSLGVAMLALGSFILALVTSGLV